jgi:hypothetical protein
MPRIRGLITGVSKIVYRIDSDVSDLVDHLIRCHFVQYYEQPSHDVLRRASDSDYDAVVVVAACEVLQRAGFEISAIVGDISQLIFDGVGQLFIVIFVEISRVSRGNGGETSSPDQVGNEYINILIEIEFDKQFTQGLLPGDQSNLPGRGYVLCAH